MVLTWILVDRLLMTDPVSLSSLLVLGLAVLNTGLAIRPSFGYIAADEEGLTVHPGIGRVRHVEWTDVRGIRVPGGRGAPTVERYEGSDIWLRGLIAHSEVDDPTRMVSSWAERSGGRGR